MGMRRAGVASYRSRRLRMLGVRLVERCRAVARSGFYRRSLICAARVYDDVERRGGTVVECDAEKEVELEPFLAIVVGTVILCKIFLICSLHVVHKRDRR